jgi:methionyl-tRNA synthetase
MKDKKIKYITTTIPYVNAAPHIGHALEFVQADVIARHSRIQGNKTYFLSGSDENAIKNVQAAEKEGVSIEDLVLRNANEFKKLLEKLHISIDQFIRTSEGRHKIGAQALWDATKKEDLYKKKYQGWYCQGCETFYNPEELNESGECAEHPGKKLERIEEENYFFKLSNYQTWLEGVIEKDELKIIPQSKRNEVLAFIKRGLEDFSVSRPIERTKNWGVSVPREPSQTMYVWYDALANYITALGYPDVDQELFKTFWIENEKKVHVLGKGVSRFHAVYWLAMLKSAGLPIPNEEFIHGYITVEGQKISKTIGNVVDPFAIIEKFGVDSVRYYLLREISSYEDGDFSEEKFKDRYNGDLANGLGNLVSRVIKMARSYGVLFDSTDKEIRGQEGYDHAMEKYEFQKALAIIWERIQISDKFIQETQPFKAIKTDPEKAKRDVQELLGSVWEIAMLLQPFLPETSKKILSVVEDQSTEIPVLFPRLN